MQRRLLQSRKHLKTRNVQRFVESLKTRMLTIQEPLRSRVLQRPIRLKSRLVQQSLKPRRTLTLWHSLSSRWVRFLNKNNLLRSTRRNSNVVFPLFSFSSVCGWPRLSIVRPAARGSGSWHPKEGVNVSRSKVRRNPFRARCPSPLHQRTEARPDWPVAVCQVRQKQKEVTRSPMSWRPTSALLEHFCETFRHWWTPHVFNGIVDGCASV